MNEKSIFESQEKQIVSLTKQVKASNDSITKVYERLEQLEYFSLLGNDNAMTYLENLGLDPVATENSVREAILEQNLVQGGSPLIPLEGMDGEMRINNMRFLNHRWVQAEITDGTYWGEMILEYFYNDQMELELTPVSTVLYPN